MHIAESKTRQQFPLSSRKVTKKFIESSLGYLVLLGFLFGLAAYVFTAINQVFPDWADWLGTAALVFLALYGVILLLNYFYQRWYFAVYFYDLTPDFIQIKKGPITPLEITIPYERIQDVYVDQDILDRMFGLYDVHLSSATASSGAQAHIDGVEKEAADGLRAILLQTVKERISKYRSVSSPL